MNLKVKVLILLLVLNLLSGCGKNKLSSAELTNLIPATIQMNNATYIMTDEILITNDIEEQIGKITKVHKLVSYSEEDDPYKSLNRIFKVKDSEVKDVIAVEVGDKLYKAKKETNGRNTGNGY